MIDDLILLLSTDWFLPYWVELGIFIKEEKKIEVQQGCRQIVNAELARANDRYLADVSEERKRTTGTTFRKLLRKCGTEKDLAAALSEWKNLSHNELSAVVECAMFNSQIPSADGTGEVPYLEFSIRAAVIEMWETYRLSASVYRDVCLGSQTSWDIHVQKLSVSPKTLVNQLWRVLLNRRLHTFWSKLGERLTSEQLKVLTSWYRAMIRIELQEDRSDLIPSFMR